MSHRLAMAQLGHQPSAVCRWVAPRHGRAGVARIPITVDIGFGDAVEPGVEDIDLPVLLDMPSPHLRA